MKKIQYHLCMLLCLLYMALNARLDAQIIYVNGEIGAGFGGIIKVDLATCTFCAISEMNDDNDYDMVILPNGNAVNASGGFIAIFDPPQTSPITFLNIAPVQTRGNILNPAGTIYQATTQGLGIYNPVTNQFTYIGDWPANFLPILEMELWYQGGQLYGYFGFPVQQVAQIDVNTPGNSVIVGAVSGAGGFLQGACNIGNTVYVANEQTIFIYDPATGNLDPVCDFTGTLILMEGLSSSPPGFQDYACACTTNAGSITTQSLTNYCTDETVNVAHNGNQVLDGNDLLQYVLFGNPGDTAGSIVATSNTPNFSFGPPMQTGVTYYVAAVVGNNVGGNVDLTDPCLDFSNANAMVWRPLPTVVLSAANTNICTAVGCTTVQATLTGTPPFSFTYEIQRNGTAISPLVTVNAITNVHDFVVCLPPNAPLGDVQVVVCSVEDTYCNNP
jgi:hypothetical protein